MSLAVSAETSLRPGAYRTPLEGGQPSLAWTPRSILNFNELLTSESHKNVNNCCKDLYARAFVTSMV